MSDRVASAALSPVHQPVIGVVPGVHHDEVVAEPDGGLLLGEDAEEGDAVGYQSKHYFRLFCNLQLNFTR